MATLAGIDLGTTYSALAVLNGAGEPEIVPIFNGDHILPSAVVFNEDGTIAVGEEAKNRLSDDPEHVVQFVKRKMADPDYQYKVFGKEYSPVKISAMILKKLKEECNAEGDIRDVIITVPAAFSDKERKSTRAAGEIAGLNVLDVINEPTAAAIYYASQIKDVRGTILVYDLGGGTFDVTILKYNSANNIRVLTSKGDVHLGGVDFDRAIVKLFNEHAKKVLGKGFFKDEFVDTWDEKILRAKDRAFFYKLMKHAEQVKKSLTNRPRATASFVTPQGENFSMEITREKFEESISGFIGETKVLMETALEDAKLSRSQIDKILLVGGSTRIPCVQQSIKRLFNKAPENPINVDEAVALGAALYCAVTKKEQAGEAALPVSIRKKIEQVKVVDVCNMNFGTIVLRVSKEEYFEVVRQFRARGIEEPTDEFKRIVSKNVVLLKKNSKLPCSNSKTFYTVSESAVVASITEWPEATDDPCINVVKEVEISFPHPVPVGTPVQVEFEYDKGQCLHVYVECDGEFVEEDIDYSDLLTAKEIERQRQENEDVQIVEL